MVPAAGHLALLASASGTLGAAVGLAGSRLPVPTDWSAPWPAVPSNPTIQHCLSRGKSAQVVEVDWLHGHLLLQASWLHTAWRTSQASIADPLATEAAGELWLADALRRTLGVRSMVVCLANGSVWETMAWTNQSFVNRTREAERQAGLDAYARLMLSRGSRHTQWGEDQQAAHTRVAISVTVIDPTQLPDQLTRITAVATRDSCEGWTHTLAASCCCPDMFSAFAATDCPASLLCLEVKDLNGTAAGLQRIVDALRPEVLKVESVDPLVQQAHKGLKESSAKCLEDPRYPQIRCPGATSSRLAEVPHTDQPAECLSTYALGIPANIQPGAAPRFRVLDNGFVAPNDPHMAQGE